MDSTLRQKGFSLVELMVAITVLALILLVAMPAVASWLDSTRIRNIVESLQSGLQTARAEAVRRNKNVSFWLVSGADPAVLGNDCELSSASASWVISINSPAGHCGDAPSNSASPMLVAGRPAGASGGRISVAALQADQSSAGTSITFDGFGRVTNGDAIGLIKVTGADTDVNLQLMISSTGSVRMCDPRTVIDANDPRKC
jgi:type IV fimbrial biogenesis protein FimT